MFKRIAVLISALVLIASAKTIIVRVQARDYAELSQHVTFKGTSINIAGAVPGKSYDLALDESDLPLVSSSGLASEVIVPDLEGWEEVAGRLGQYHSYSEQLALLRGYVLNYPTLCVMESIGPSYEGRWIYGLKITNNPQVEDTLRHEVLIYGQIHAREWATSEMILHMIDTLLSNYNTNPGFQSFINNRRLWIFPIFNVDGYVYDYPGQLMWRKNRQPYGGAIGTDMNRDGNGVCNNNPQAEWGALVRGSRTSHYPDDETFEGAKGEFAPEVKALANLHRAHNFVEELSVHSYSELVLWSYGHGELTPDDSFISRVGRGVAGQIQALGGGTYTAEQSVSLYPTNGDVEDWFYGWARMIGGFPCFDLEFEVGTTFYQPTGNLDGMATQVFKGTWYFLNRLDTVLTRIKPLVPRPFIAAVTGPVDTDFVLHWTPTRSRFNLPDKWELEELRNFTVRTESVEGVTDLWTLQGATTSTTQKHSGNKSFFLGNTSNMDNWVVTNEPFPVSSAVDSLTFWTWYNLENNFDVGTAEVSLEGREWFQLDNAFTGSSSGWVRKAYSLAPWLGKSVFIRLRAMSDDGTNSGGMYVDDISPVARFENHTILSSNILDTLFVVPNPPDGDYWYRARGHNLAWGWGMFGPLTFVRVAETGVSEPGKPGKEVAGPALTRISSVAPNPSFGPVRISYALARPGPVSLSVFDATGSLVRVLQTGTGKPGYYSSSWDGRDALGRLVPAGVYVLSLDSDRKVSERILRLR